LQVGVCLFGVIGVLYAFACGPQTPPPQVATPTFSPEGGSYTNSVDVTIACDTEGATIRYTTDGSDPNGSSTECTGAIQLTSTTTLTARAFMAGMTDSEVASATYTITVTPPPPEQVATPTFTPEGGTYGDWVDVTIACATGGATIRYTIDGSTPTSEHGTLYNPGNPIHLTETTALKAIAYRSGMASSLVAEATYAIKRAKLLASDGAADEWFGISVSVSGDVAVVGADYDDDNGSYSGSAYVFRWNGASWVEQAKLVASDGAASDYFGRSVSVSGDVALVGAPYDDDNGANSGSAYVFRWNGTSWAQEPNKLLASDGATSDYFGWSVSVSGDVAVVGAWGDDDKPCNSGSAHIFERNQGGPDKWGQVTKLVASDGAGGDEFGHSVSVSGDVAVVGALEDDGKGSAYVYRRNGTSWVEQPKLVASDGAGGDEFGCSVSVSGDVAVIGAQDDDDNGAKSGSAYVFRRNGTTWVQQANLLAPDGAAGDCFGCSVSVSGDVVVVGACGDDDNGSYSGSAYVFRWNGAVWVQQAKLLASDGAADDWFGRSVSVSGDVAAVGAYLDDDNGSGSGSAYVFGVLP